MSHTLLKGIIDFRKSDDALPSSRGCWTTLPSKIRKRVVTTKGWVLLVECIDGTTSWILLKNLKESNPIEGAEYSTSHSIQNKPTFAWWVSHVLRKLYIVMKTLQLLTVKKNTKFGIMIPSTIEEARSFDRVNKNNFWEKALQK